jgi:hypothetical protein
MAPQSPLTGLLSGQRVASKWARRRTLIIIENRNWKTG